MNKKLKSEIISVAEKVVQLEDNFIDLAFELEQLKVWNLVILKIY